MILLQSSLHQNVLTTVATVVYTKGVVGGCDYAVARRWIAADISRKIIHVAAGSWCLFWPLFRRNNDDDDASWMLNIAVPAVYSVQLFVKGLILQDPNDADVKTMSRSGKPLELCQGPFLFTCAMMYCGLYQFRTEVGVYIMGALTYGDGIAPLIGKRFPWGRYPTLGGGTKTLAGSAAMFVGTLIGICILQAGIGAPERLDAGKMLGVAALATLAEAVSGIWDNPAIVLTTLWYCQRSNA